MIKIILCVAWKSPWRKEPYLGGRTHALLEDVPWFTSPAKRLSLGKWCERPWPQHLVSCCDSELMEYKAAEYFKEINSFTRLQCPLLFASQVNCNIVVLIKMDLVFHNTNKSNQKVGGGSFLAETGLGVQFAIQSTCLGGKLPPPPPPLYSNVFDVSPKHN